jgi:hypothetical protein
MLTSDSQRLERAEMLRSGATLPVVFLVAVYFGGAVELFEEDDPGEGMRECDAAEGPEGVGTLQYIGGEAERATDHESYVTAARGAEVLQLQRDSFRWLLLSFLPVEGDHVRFLGEAFQDTLSFCGEHFFGGAAVHVFLDDLDDVYGEVAAQSFFVVLGGFGGPGLWFSDGDQGAAAYHSIPKSCSAALRSP